MASGRSAGRPIELGFIGDASRFAHVGFMGFFMVRIQEGNLMQVTFGQQRLQFGMVRRQRLAPDAGPGPSMPAPDTDVKDSKNERRTKRPADDQGFKPVPLESLVGGMAPKTDHFEYASAGTQRLLHIRPNSVAIKKRKIDNPVPAIDDVADIGHGSAEVQRLLKIRPDSVVVKSRNGQDTGRIETKPCPKDREGTLRWIDAFAALHEEQEKWGFRIKAKKAEVDDDAFALDPQKIQSMKAKRSKEHTFYYEPFADLVIPNRDKLERGEGIDEEAQERNRQNAVMRAKIRSNGGRVF